MATYPDHPQLLGSRLEPEEQVIEDRGTDGTLRWRVLWSGKGTLRLRHLLNSADLASLEAFYAANLAAAVDVTWRASGAVYACHMRRPRAEPLGGGRHRVDVELVII